MYYNCRNIYVVAAFDSESVNTFPQLNKRNLIEAIVNVNVD